METEGEAASTKPVEVTPKRVGLHDANTDSSQLSVLTASNTTLPHLEPTDAEERGKKKEARKLKRAAREKKKEQQRLDEKKARKEARSSREKKEEREEKKGRRKRSKLPTHHLVNSLVAPKMVTMMSPIKFITRRTRRRKRAARTAITNMQSYPSIILLCLTMIASLSSMCPWASCLISMGPTLPSGST
jgi:cation transport ATPase